MPRLQTIWYSCLVTWGLTTSQKCSKLAPSFFSPDWCNLLVSYGGVSTHTHSPLHWVSHFSRRVLLFVAMATHSRPARRLQNHVAKPSVEFGVSSALCSKSLLTLSSCLLQQISNLKWTVVTETNDIKVWCSRLCHFLDHILWHNSPAAEWWWWWYTRNISDHQNVSVIKHEVFLSNRWICHQRSLEYQRNGVAHVSHYNVGLCHHHSSPLRSRVTDYVIFLSHYRI
jgi:hypothetical protein